MHDWPVNSLDLNIIEEVWKIMKRHMRSSRPTIFCAIKRTDRQHLVQVQELESLAASMPKILLQSFEQKWRYKIQSVIFYCFSLKKDLSVENWLRF